jgi:hypothetical protein
MSRNPLFYVLVALALGVLATLAIRTGVATSRVVSVGHGGYDEVESARAGFHFGGSADLSDYWLRHRDEFSQMAQADLSDYALRHPGATILLEPAPDPSDYFSRHRAEISQIARPDLSDYALRHPGAPIAIESAPIPVN